MNDEFAKIYERGTDGVDSMLIREKETIHSEFTNIMNS